MADKKVSTFLRVTLATFTLIVFVTGAWASIQEKVLHSFTPQGSDGAFPTAPLIADASGNRYGIAAAGGTDDAGTVFELSPREGGGWTEKVIYNFKSNDGDGNSPHSGLVFDAHGDLYGTTTLGGAYNGGTIFELTPHSDGDWTEAILYSFGHGTDGSAPYFGSLIFDASGNLYGTTSGGGAYGAGTVYELSPRHGGGWTEAVLYSFDPYVNGADGAAPYAGLVFDSHGNLYGTTLGGGSFNSGTAFELSPQHGGGWTETVLYTFCSMVNCTDGAQPYAGLILDSSGNLYGTTNGGGYYSGGIAFELSSGLYGWTETVMRNFGNGTDGSAPGCGNLVKDSSGDLYGVTIWGGSYGFGTVFEFSPRHGGGWTESILHDFDVNGSDGWGPWAGLTLDASGDLYGTTNTGGTKAAGTVFELTHTEHGWSESVLYSFNFEGTDGANPQFAGVIFDDDGNLYGTTLNGGAHELGSVFELKPNHNGSWTEELLYSFPGTPTDAANPSSGMIFDSHGNLYGTTLNGGAHESGAVFELSPREGGGWTEKVLYSFNHNGSDGLLPFSGLVFDHAGNLYGTTAQGGTYNEGTVFELTPHSNGTWTETVLYSFYPYGTDGLVPYATLIFDGSGYLYGTTTQGGTYSNGTVFELTPNSNGTWTETILYSFNNDGEDGTNPYGALVFDGSGDLYGTNTGGGAYLGGTVFELTPHHHANWTESLLHTFGDGTDGATPYGNLIFDAHGNLYGTTSGGGVHHSGIVFELTPEHNGTWTETVMHSFNPSGADGNYPEGGLIFDSDGNLYGTTYFGGGSYNAGTVFEIEP